MFLKCGQLTFGPPPPPPPPPQQKNTLSGAHIYYQLHLPFYHPEEKYVADILIWLSFYSQTAFMAFVFPFDLHFSLLAFILPCLSGLLTLHFVFLPLRAFIFIFWIALVLLYCWNLKIKMQKIKNHWRIYRKYLIRFLIPSNKSRNTVPFRTNIAMSPQHKYQRIYTAPLDMTISTKNVFDFM